MRQLSDVFTDLTAEGEALEKIIAGLAGSDPDLFVRMTAGAEKDFDAAVAELLPASVLACAGMMELFAHGQDIADTIGAHTPTGSWPVPR